MQETGDAMSELLAKGQTPEKWSETLMSHGVHVSPRLIRFKARRSGQYYKIGRLMLLTPEQLEKLLAVEGEAERDET